MIENTLKKIHPFTVLFLSVVLLSFLDLRKDGISIFFAWLGVAVGLIFLVMNFQKNQAGEIHFKVNGWIFVLAILSLIYMRLANRFGFPPYNYGIYRSYYEPGKLKAEAFYRHGRRHGAYHEFWRDNTVAQEGNFLGGKKEGLFKTFDQTERLIREEFYHDDKLQSYKTYNYHEQYSSITGYLKTEESFVGGRKVQQRDCNPHGCRRVEFLYDQGRLQGSRQYDENGQLVSELMAIE